MYKLLFLLIKLNGFIINNLNLKSQIILNNDLNRDNNLKEDDGIHFIDYNFHDLDNKLNELLIYYETNFYDTDKYLKINYEDLNDGKLYHIQNIDNKKIKYLGWIPFKETDIDLTLEEKNEPLYFIFIKVMPLLKILNLEMIIRNPKLNVDVNLLVLKEQLIELANMSNLTLNSHNLIFNKNKRWYLEFNTKLI